MKSVVAECREAKNKYPYLGVFTDRTVILFTKENTGTCLFSVNEKGFGVYSDQWAENNATRLDKAITLSNSW